MIRVDNIQITSGYKFQVAFSKPVNTIEEATEQSYAGIQFIGFYRERDLASLFCAATCTDSYEFNSNEEFALSGSGNLIPND